MERGESFRIEQLEREERMQTEILAMDKGKFEMEEKERERQYNLRRKELEMPDKVKKTK